MIMIDFKTRNVVTKYLGITHQQIFTLIVRVEYVTVYK